MMRIDYKDYYHETSRFTDHCRPFLDANAGAGRLALRRTAIRARKKYDTQRFTQNLYAARFAFRRGVGKNDHGE
ncbi:hypothetical protein SDC9_210257 [bioreactor metagenome]|uniref:Uncharacterized protein n=1 Tax=bioreactor metagenome TaxID=1076179 RepID=A0A645JFM7_9ZZZZ